jgi:hypothetical protein
LVKLVVVHDIALRIQSASLPRYRNSRLV